MLEIIFATKNIGKIKEINKIIESEDFDAKVITMEEAGITFDVVEDGNTFEENALKKAREIMEFSKKTTIADDSGLEIDFLDKAPGIYSARYLGEDTPYQIKNAKILELLKDVPFEKRTARFVCAIGVVLADGKTFTKTATMEGYIHTKIEGENGFGYDPIFFLPKYGKTSATLTMEEKNKISHRGFALKMAIDEMKKLN